MLTNTPLCTENLGSDLAVMEFAFYGAVSVPGLKAATVSLDSPPVPPRSASSDPAPQVDIGILLRLGFVQPGKKAGRSARVA